MFKIMILIIDKVQVQGTMSKLKKLFVLNSHTHTQISDTNPNILYYYITLLGTNINKIGARTKIPHSYSLTLMLHLYRHDKTSQTIRANKP